MPSGKLRFSHDYWNFRSFPFGRHSPLHTMDSDLVTRAKFFAIGRHGQQQRAGGQPYYVHLKNVAELVEIHGGTHDMIAAAWLHDVVEDTDTSLGEVMKWFGPDVCGLVDELTDKFPPAPGRNRASRKAMETERLANVSAEAQLIKMADVIDNLEHTPELDSGFRPLYLEELEHLIGALSKAPKDMRALASSVHERQSI